MNQSRPHVLLAHKLVTIKRKLKELEIDSAKASSFFNQHTNLRSIVLVVVESQLRNQFKKNNTICAQFDCSVHRCKAGSRFQVERVAEMDVFASSSSRKTPL